MNEDIIRDLYYAQSCELMRAEIRYIVDSLSPTDRRWLFAGYSGALSNLNSFYTATMSSEEAIDRFHKELNKLWKSSVEKVAGY